MKPIALVAPEFVTLTKEAYLVREEYVKQLRDAGAIVLGAGHTRKAKEYARFADALLLPDGSAPVHASRYGQYDKTFQDAMKSMTTWDDMDVALCKAFWRRASRYWGSDAARISSILYFIPNR